MAEKVEKFGMVMTVEEKQALDDLARLERISQAAVLRRLIWQAATKAAQPAQPSEVSR